MSLDIKYIKDTEGNNYFPVVHERGVVDDNGTTLESKLQSKQDAISDIDTIRSKANSAIQSVTVGTTTTGEAGSSANVINTGTATAPIISFTIPQGAQGIQGPTGPQGERGLPGESGVTGDVSAFTVHQTIDPSTTYAATDIAGAASLQATNQELTELAGKQKFYTGEELNLTGITEDIMFGSKKLIESGGVYSAFNLLIQLLRKAAYTENDAEETLNALQNLISGIDVPITGITIVGDASIVGSAVYVATLSPTDTTERDIIWSIDSGNEYAVVLSNGTLIVIDNGSVVLKCESRNNSSVYDTKTITVTDSASHFMPLTSNTSDTVGSLTPAKSSYTSISSDGMQFTAGSDDGLSYGYNANFKTFIFDLKYSKSSLAWQYFFGNWAGSNVSTLGFAIKTNTDEICYTTSAGDYSANKTMSENTWHRIGIQIISSTSAALWIDGEKIITPTFTSRDITHYLFGNNWRFQAANGTRALNGYIKNLKIYDNVLSDDFMTIKTQIL